ncbi:hypothetical protein CR513_47280, partial [Mucuna pruriens]
MEMARSMLKEKGLPNTFWAKVVYTVVYILNICSTKAVQDKTLIEAWTRQNPSAKHLRKLTINRDVEIDENAGWNWEEEKVNNNIHVLMQQPQEEAEEVVGDLEKNNTWELVDCLHGKYIVGVKWVYKTKLNPDGTMQKNKARLVAKGYSQQPRIDYNEKFAVVARLDTIRALIALTTQKGWSIYQLDVKFVFLNGVLEEEIYVDQPQGFINKGNEGKVLRLRKALYGLKQAPRAWYNRID